MNEPEFISQTEVIPGSREAINWMTDRSKETQEKGARWHRWSWHPDIPNLLLHEAWHVRPVDDRDNLAKRSSLLSGECPIAPENERAPFLGPGDRDI